MPIGDPVVKTCHVDRPSPYLRIDVSGNPPPYAIDAGGNVAGGGVPALLDPQRLATELDGNPRPVLLNFSGLWSVTIPQDIDWLRGTLLPMLGSSGVRRVVVVTGTSTYEWGLRPWEQALASGNPSVLCLPSSWYADEAFRSGRKWEDAEGEWLGQAEEWLAGA